MHPAMYEPKQIIEAGLIPQAEGRNITGFTPHNQVGGGNPTCLRQIWDEHRASQSTVITEPVAELPTEVAEEVKAVFVTPSERTTQLVIELSSKVARAAERRAAEVTRAAGGQTARAKRELADAAQAVDDLEEKLDGLQDRHDRLTLVLELERALRQRQDVEMAQLKERLAAVEKSVRQREERYQEQKTMLQDALSVEQAQHKSARKDLQRRLGQISTEADTRTEELKSERDKVDILLTYLELQENMLVSKRQQHQAIREMLQQRLEQVVVDAQARVGELAPERSRVNSLTAGLESQEKVSLEQLVRMGNEVTSLTDRCTQPENQRDNARLETMGERETATALCDEAEILKHQNQSLMVALSGNKQTGDQDT